MRIKSIFLSVVIILMFQFSEGNRQSVPARNHEALRQVDHHSKRRNAKEKKSKKSKKSKKIKKETKAPTASPSVSMQPSLHPTDFPSNLPTISMMPSLSPSQVPSNTPSVAPSPNPSSLPSKEPSSTPSYNPTTSPSSSPSLSQMPSSTPSYRPSHMPSLTPSSKPSYNPTSNPSEFPTSIPSLTPSYRPSTSPSSIPSTQPSLKPTRLPSVSPSFSPSFRPSSSPTAQPTNTPSLFPTQKPSSSPSTHPSISFWPSSVPSISSAPSRNIISGLKRIQTEDGEIGLQSGCPIPPNTSDAIYAEETAIRDVVSFVYSVNIFNDAPLNEITTSVETRLHQKLFDDYVNCATTRRLNDNYIRHLDQVNATMNMSVMSRPIGVSSLPKDTQSDQTCSNSNIEETCVIIDGAITFLFEPDSDGFTDFLQQSDALSFIKNEIDNMGDINGISEITFAGTIGDDELSNTDVSFIIPRVQSVENPENDEEVPKMASFGYIVIAGAATTLIIVVLFAVKRNKTRTYQRKEEEILLSGFKDNYCKKENDVGVIRNGRQRLDSDASSESQDAMDTLDNELRDIHHNNQLQGPDDFNSLHEFIEVDINDFNAQHFTQQVHHCTSSTCQVCRRHAAGKSVKFVNVENEEEEGIEVDITGNINRDSHGHDGFLRSPTSFSSSVRSYETPDSYGYDGFLRSPTSLSSSVRSYETPDTVEF